MKSVRSEKFYKINLEKDEPCLYLRAGIVKSTQFSQGKVEKERIMMLEDPS